MTMQNKKVLPLLGENEAQAARLFGRHVSKEKAWVLFLSTMLVCLLPMAAGLRLWNSIPEIVTTGITKWNGQDDSMPRALLVFGVPGLFCLLNLIVHLQLSSNQARMTMPNAFARLFGRVGLCVCSTLASHAAIFGAAGLSSSLPLMATFLLGLALLLLGAHMLDCPTTSPIALRFSFTEQSPLLWERTHRFASYLWLSAGLGMLALVSIFGAVSPYYFLVAAAALAAPIFYGHISSRRVA